MFWHILHPFSTWKYSLTVHTAKVIPEPKRKLKQYVGKNPHSLQKKKKGFSTSSHLLLGLPSGRFFSNILAKILYGSHMFPMRAACPFDGENNSNYEVHHCVIISSLPCISFFLKWTQNHENSVVSSFITMRINVIRSS